MYWCYIPIRYSIGMETLREGDTRPTIPNHPPTQARINGLLWVSPHSSTINRIHASAMAFKSPLNRLAGVSDSGEWKGINWEDHADWFDLQVHWRGYLPVEVLTEARWETSEDLIVPMGNGFRLTAKVANWRRRQIEALGQHLELLCDLLGLEAEGIPYPGTIDLEPLTFLQPTREAVRRVMGVSRYHYLDMIAFYRWVREAMDDELIYREWDRTNPPLDLWLHWEETQVVGYLIDLQEHRKVHNLPMWKCHDVPVHYIWNDTVAGDERYQYWNPSSLRARDETPGAAAEANIEPHIASRGRQGFIADDWMQCINPSEDHVLKDASLPGRERSWTFWVQDFDNWEVRQVTNRHEIELFAQIYVYVDQPEGSGPKRTFLRWRESTVSAAEVIAASVYEPHHHSPQYVREVFKFWYGTGPDHIIGNRSLLSRIEGPSSSRRERSSAGLAGSSEARGETRPTSREGGRGCSASPRSNSSSVRRHRSPETGRVRRLPVADSEGASSFGSTSESIPYGSGLSATSPIQTPLRGHLAVLAIKPLMSPENVPDFVVYGSWNKKYLEKAVISFPKARAQWRIRSWLFEDPSLPLTQMLGRAISYCVPFRLEMPEANVQEFRKPRIQYQQWERDAALYYRPGYRDPQVEYTANKAELAGLYVSSVLPLLRKPNAPAFLFEGGLLARIARHFGGQDLIDRAMLGLSAAVTLHRAGEVSADRDTQRESVTPWEQQALLGYTKVVPPQQVTHSVFPPVSTFEETCLLYEEAWTDECEDWFKRMLARCNSLC
ncbi:hypothetical protein HWV62_34699 [Athelia sp. TMB]|nr:hypothetical protein HWV62_34699 [Athelia sp. TMB]